MASWPIIPIRTYSELIVVAFIKIQPDMPWMATNGYEWLWLMTINNDWWWLTTIDHNLTTNRYEWLRITMILYHNWPRMMPILLRITTIGYERLWMMKSDDDCRWLPMIDDDWQRLMMIGDDWPQFTMNDVFNHHNFLLIFVIRRHCSDLVSLVNNGL